MGKNKKQAVKKNQYESTDPEILKVRLLFLLFIEPWQRRVCEKQL